MSLKRKRNSYDAQFKLKIIKFAEENNNSAADRHFAVSEKLVRDWRKQKKYLFEMPWTKRAKHYGVSLYIKLERALNDWVLEYCHNGYIITRMMIQIQAIKFTRDKQYETGTGSPLSLSNTISPLLQESDMFGLRARLTGSSLKSSPLRGDECITDQKTLEQFLIKQLDKEQKRQTVSRTVSPAGSSSFWNQSPGLIDQTSLLSKYQYQVACRSPQQTKVKGDDIDEPVSYLAEEVWASQNVHLADVDRWIENLRKWLSRTILSHLLHEIDKINDTLARIGCEDMQIGEVGIATLKQLATTKVLHVPTLNSVVPFLEVCANQEYLVSRIRELGAGGAMSSYKWNGGGVFKGKPWGQHLPTDAAILMHLLCSYMDARLLPHPKYPDGKTFTAQYFVKTPDKPDLVKKDNLLLYQAKVNPPHFKVILEDHVLSPPKGRNNMFHAILLFLHHIHVKHHGMLGRINLGLSGINILWILDASPQQISPTQLVHNQAEDNLRRKRMSQHIKYKKTPLSS
ncbi:hypothetical protein LSH36_178g04112 [Paralvinella palmiformis]|uniref:Brinker DNA-binding domain-containing protein n=1 Tax=Paralvinella palmiformis TaxID=53620 RepID=A0AAD9JT12_9ANNE|nr:hypothetical protein LSH36_178g04112 [Paralvinella palmiformis]